MQSILALIVKLKKRTNILIKSLTKVNVKLVTIKLTKVWHLLKELVKATKLPRKIKELLKKIILKKLATILA